MNFISQGYFKYKSVKLIFSNLHLSVVHFCCCWRKTFTSSSSPEPQGQFQPNSAQIILVWRWFKFVQMKGPALFQGDIIINWQILKIFSLRTTGEFQPNLAQSILEWREFKFFLNEGVPPFSQGDKYKIVKIHRQIL